MFWRAWREAEAARWCAARPPLYSPSYGADVESRVLKHARKVELLC